jgi:hypothetical protein
MSLWQLGPLGLDPAFHQPIVVLFNIVPMATWQLVSYKK